MSWWQRGVRTTALGVAAAVHFAAFGWALAHDSGSAAGLAFVIGLLCGFAAVLREDSDLT